MIKEYRKGRRFVRLFYKDSLWRVTTENGYEDYENKESAVSVMNKIKGEFWK